MAGQKQRSRSHALHESFISLFYQKGIVLSAFLFGYFFSGVPGGMLADRYGGTDSLLRFKKKFKAINPINTLCFISQHCIVEMVLGKIVMTVAVLLWSTFTILTPWASRVSFAMLVLVRVLLGVAEVQRIRNALWPVKLFPIKVCASRVCRVCSVCLRLWRVFMHSCFHACHLALFLVGWWLVA